MDFVGIHYLVHYYYTVEISYSYLGCYVPVKLLILYLHLQQVSQVINIGSVPTTKLQLQKYMHLQKYK